MIIPRFAAHSKILSLLCSLWLCHGCAQANTNSTADIVTIAGRLNFELLDRKLLEMIRDKGVGVDDLQKAIEHLGKPVEDPQFWTQIANDDSFSVEHRRKCVFAFFRRHGMQRGSLS